MVSTEDFGPSSGMGSIPPWAIVFSSNLSFDSKKAVSHLGIPLFLLYKFYPLYSQETIQPLAKKAAVKASQFSQPQVLAICSFKEKIF